jgi:deoxyribonuclease V
METFMVNYEGLKIPQATIIQNQLRQKVAIRERDFEIKTIAGADISLNLYSTTVYAGIILLSFPQLKPLGYSLVKAETRFPYVPGYLAFREVPALYSAWNQMPAKPDVLVVDGHGIAHPRRMGIAAHFGALSGQPTIGSAKKILWGKFNEPALTAGSYSPINDKGEVIGYTLRSKTNVKPVFISPGHLLSLQNTLDIMKQCLGKYRIPEPTRLAHELVNKFRKGELKGGFHTIE